MLSGRLALITGSTGGIGMAIAKTFAKEGAAIAMVDIHKQANHALKEINNARQSNDHSYHRCDVSSKREVQDVFANLKKHSPHNGVPDIIINNAGVYTSNQLTEFEEADIDQILDVNLKGTILVTQEATRQLLSHYENKKHKHPQTYASIINISSLSGKNGCPTESPYSASKAGVEGFTRSVAKELGQYRIRCNAILPGLIKTPMLMHESRVEQVNRLAAMTTLKRLGEPDEVASVCLFLASEMSSYINGASIDCNGGLAF